jgi:hypothetical protein
LPEWIRTRVLPQQSLFRPQQSSSFDFAARSQ